MNATKKTPRVRKGRPAKPTLTLTKPATEPDAKPKRIAPTVFITFDDTQEAKVKDGAEVAMVQLGDSDSLDPGSGFGVWHEIRIRSTPGVTWRMTKALRKAIEDFVQREADAQ